MPKRITFQFEDDLDYQMQAIRSTIELFRGLSRNVDGIYRPNRTRKFGEGDPVRNSDIVVGTRLLKIIYLQIIRLKMEIILQLRWKRELVKRMCIFVRFLNYIKNMGLKNL